MQLVFNYNEKVTTTSILVAEKFGKEHNDVLEVINSIDCSEQFRQQNFAISSYKSNEGIDLPMYLLTRDAFTMLMMSFSGKRAVKFREEFISEFNRMEDILKQKKTPVLIPVYQKRILSQPTKNCPNSHWNVFDAAHSMMLLIEVNIGSLCKYDLVDGSIGLRWSAFRKDKPWAKKVSTYIYVHDDHRGQVESKCYEYSEMEYFKTWLNDVYKKEHLYAYLKNKYTKEKNLVMLDKVNEILPKLLLAA